VTEKDFDVNELLEQLEKEERLVSARRRKLHERIAIFPDTAAAHEEEERELSTRRRELHRQIDDLRARTDDG
jgi:hypothetical protein